MNEQQGHIPPDDPWNISLSYQREHCWWYSADDALVTWHVSAYIDDGSGPDAGSHVGDMSITLVDIYETSDPLALLDGEDAELDHIAGTIFDPGDGQLVPDLDEQLEPVGSQILILHSVRLTPQWRGFGARRNSDQETVQRCPCRRLLPSPLNEPADAGAGDQGGAGPDETEWDQAVAALQRVWARLGFEHLRNGVYVLDLSLVTLDEKLRQLHHDAECYRTPATD